MSAIVKSETFDGWTLSFADRDGEPMVRDLELAERLGFARPAKVRDLLKSLLREGILSDSEVVTAAGQTSPRGGRPGQEFYLTELGAILVAMRSETPTARAISRSIGQLFVAWRRGQLEAAPRHLALDTTVANSARIGDDPVACQRYRLARQRAANATGCSIQSLDGYVRRTQRVSTWKAVSLHLLDRLVAGFEHLELGLVHLTTKRERRLLEVVRKAGQLELFENKPRRAGVH